MMKNTNLKNKASSDKDLQTIWYNNKLAFWSITFIASIIIIVLFSSFIVPVIFGDNYYVHKNADFIDKVSAFLSRLMPYLVGICGGISYLIYNIKHSNCIFTIKTYIKSIISTCAGLIISTILLFLIGLSLLSLLILSGLFVMINIFTFGRFAPRK